MHSLAQLLTDTAGTYGDRPALTLGETTVTYGALDEGAARVAGLLKARGVEPGERVACSLPNVPYFASVYYGILRAGAVVVPINVLLKDREVAFYLGDSGAVHRVARLRRGRDRGRAPGRRRGAARRSGRVRAAAGRGHARARQRRPSRVRHRRDPLHVRHHGDPQGRRAHARKPGGELPPRRHGTRHRHAGRRDPRRAAAVPLLRPDLLHEHRCPRGSRLTVIPRFDPGTALEIIQRDHVSYSPACRPCTLTCSTTPTPRYDVSSLRSCVSGGSAMPVEVMHGFNRLHCVILEGYGLSETSPVASFNHSRSRAQARLRSARRSGGSRRGRRRLGPRCPGEMGEIAIRGHNVMKGY